MSYWTIDELEQIAFRGFRELGRTTDWLKMKNPTHAAVKREAEEDWGR